MTLFLCLITIIIINIINSAEDGNVRIPSLQEQTAKTFNIKESIVSAFLQKNCYEVLHYFPSRILEQIGTDLWHFNEQQLVEFREFMDRLINYLSQDSQEIKNVYFPFLNERSLDDVYHILSSMFDIPIPSFYDKTPISDRIPVQISHNLDEKNELFLQPKARNDPRVDGNGQYKSPSILWYLIKVSSSNCYNQDNCIRLKSDFYHDPKGRDYLRKDNDVDNSGNIDCNGFTKDWSLFKVHYEQETNNMIRLQSVAHKYFIGVEKTQNGEYNIIPLFDPTAKQHPSTLLKIAYLKSRTYEKLHHSNFPLQSALKKARIAGEDSSISETELSKMNYWRAVIDIVTNYDDDNTHHNHITPGRTSPVIAADNDMNMDMNNDMDTNDNMDMDEATKLEIAKIISEEQSRQSLIMSLPPHNQGEDQDALNKILKKAENDKRRENELNELAKKHEIYPDSIPKNELNVNQYDGGFAIQHHSRSFYVQYNSKRDDKTGKIIDVIDCNAQSISHTNAIWIAEYLDNVQDSRGVYIKLKNQKILNRNDSIGPKCYLRFHPNEYEIDLEGRGKEWNIFQVQYYGKHDEKTGEQTDYYRFYSPKFNTFLGLLYMKTFFFFIIIYYLYLGVDELHDILQIPKAKDKYEVSDRTLFRLVGDVVQQKFGKLKTI